MQSARRPKSQVEPIVQNFIVTVLAHAVCMRDALSARSRSIRWPSLGGNQLATWR